MKLRNLVLGSLAVISLAACTQDAAQADLDQPKVAGNIQPTDFEYRAPDKLTIFNNVDEHPNIIRLCIGGIGFYTVSSKYVGLATAAITRVPEWDGYCSQ